MKLLSTSFGLSVLVACALLTGCGGSGGGGGAATGGIKPGPLTGVWRGNLSENSNELTMRLTRTQNTVEGTASLVYNGETYNGNVMGDTSSSNDIDVTASFPQLNGSVRIIGTFNDSHITGTASDGQNEVQTSLDRIGDN